MEIPRQLLEEAVRLMRQQRGNRALELVKNYGITSFGQLERWCRDVGIPTWREEPETRAEEGGEEKRD